MPTYTCKLILIDLLSKTTYTKINILGKGPKSLKKHPPLEILAIVYRPDDCNPYCRVTPVIRNSSNHYSDKISSV